MGVVQRVWTVAGLLAVAVAGFLPQQVAAQAAEAGAAGTLAGHAVAQAPPEPDRWADGRQDRERAGAPEERSRGRHDQADRSCRFSVNADRLRGVLLSQVLVDGRRLQLSYSRATGLAWGRLLDARHGDQLWIDWDQQHQRHDRFSRCGPFTLEDRGAAARGGHDQEITSRAYNVRIWAVRACATARGHTRCTSWWAG